MVRPTPVIRPNIPWDSPIRVNPCESVVPVQKATRPKGVQDPIALRAKRIYGEVEFLTEKGAMAEASHLNAAERRSSITWKTLHTST